MPSLLARHPRRLLLLWHRAAATIRRVRPMRLAATHGGWLALVARRAWTADREPAWRRRPRRRQRRRRRRRRRVGRRRSRRPRHCRQRRGKCPLGRPLQRPTHPKPAAYRDRPRRRVAHARQPPRRLRVTRQKGATVATLLHHGRAPRRRAARDAHGADGDAFGR
ncbi:hypothetical protein BU14_0074s0061 [Porphyra umbilicalis]|uniref:Uncharacterized protein n=1 Tax=Porphyra umbilicalis TaxID=2786 RepID=A0A1X6PFK7_PORUM|nr:hypothetical protein BU14_0074s0061 [Porphyra umbilicalis]|eukprot:OSX79631.1 hypothetical protein BU14_0074s0061 [Porphyra umbilicalis]